MVSIVQEERKREKRRELYRVQSCLYGKCMKCKLRIDMLCAAQLYTCVEIGTNPFMFASSIHVNRVY